jgi:NTE family protein
LEQKGILPQLEHVAGTSAGALAALVLAVGASGSQMKDILLNQTNFDTYMDKLFHSFIATFAVKHSLFEGEALEKDIRLKMHQLLVENLKPLQDKGVDLSFLGSLNDLEERMTFADLAKLHDLDPKTFKNLSCVGTNVTLQRAQVFSAKNSPHFPLWKAVRISMSIPLFFPAVFVDGAYFVDGGVAYNYPIDLFDKGDDVSYATLGLRLDTPKEIAVTLSNFQNPAPRNLRMANTVLEGGETKEPSFNLIPYVSNLLSYLMDQVNSGKLRRVDDKRTIYISSGSVGSTDFGLSQDKKEGLCVNGENAVKSFFTWFDIDQKNRLHGQAATAAKH